MSERHVHSPERKPHLFTPLGVYKNQCFFRTSRGVVVWFGPDQLVRPGTVLMIHPDLDHWRGLYAGTGADGVDWRRAGAALMVMAQDCGDYYPTAEATTKINLSRLPYSPRERLEAYRARQHRRKVSTMVEEAERERRQRETPAG